MAGYLTDRYGTYDENAIEQMNNVLGGDFTSRINLNIREDKHWSYGARSFLFNTGGQRPYIVFAPVQTDKTKESIQEVQKEMRDYVGTRPISAAEFDKTKQNTIMGMAGMWETNGRVNASARELVRYKLPDDYWKKYSASVQGLTLQDAQKVAKTMVQPNQMGWFLAGDAEKILPGLNELKLEVIQIDADGKPVAKKIKP